MSSIVDWLNCCCDKLKMIKFQAEEKLSFHIGPFIMLSSLVFTWRQLFRAVLVKRSDHEIQIPCMEVY